MTDITNKNMEKFRSNLFDKGFIVGDNIHVAPDDIIIAIPNDEIQRLKEDGVPVLLEVFNEFIDKVSSKLDV